ESEPPVRIFVMGGGTGNRTADGKLSHGGRWRNECEWPLARTKFTDYFLHADGSLSTEAPKTGAAPQSYIFDPSHPVPTVGGTLAGIMETAESSNVDHAWRRLVNPVNRLKHIVTVGPMHQREAPDVFGAQAPYPLLAD